MVWHHKTAPELEIKPMSDAKDFASKTRRFGFGTTMSITQQKEKPMKRDEGVEVGVVYRSKLGEARSVKMKANG